MESDGTSNGDAGTANTGSGGGGGAGNPGTGSGGAGGSGVVILRVAIFQIIQALHQEVLQLPRGS